MEICGRTILSRLSIDDNLLRDCFQDGVDSRKQNGGLRVPKVRGVDGGNKTHIDDHEVRGLR